MITSDLFSEMLPKPLHASVISNATEAQILRLRDYLRHRSCHTHELRRVGISHPAGRVQDLINRGFTITTSRVTTVDTDGYTHHGVALYSLIAEPEREVSA